MTDERVDFVLIFALKKELNAFLVLLKEYETRKTDITFHKAKVSSENKKHIYQIVALGLPEMGNYEATAATTRAIDVWRPHQVLLGGIAGGVKKAGVRLGDIIVADLIVAYEPGKQKDAGLQRRLKTLRPASDLLEVARNLKQKDWALDSIVPRPDGADERTIPRVHFGTAISGEKVIADKLWMKTVSEDIKKQLGSSAGKIAGVEMEAYGTALACYRAPEMPGILMAKSYCDWADKTKNNDWQEYASAISASFLMALIKSSTFSPGGMQNFAIRKDAKFYSGRSKIGLCKRMGDDWEDLADYFDIPLDKRRGFRLGRECQHVWEWLELRGRLDVLPEALEGIGRKDLIKELIIAV